MNAIRRYFNEVAIGPRYIMSCWEGSNIDDGKDAAAYVVFVNVARHQLLFNVMDQRSEGLVHNSCKNAWNISGSPGMKYKGMKAT